MGGDFRDVFIAPGIATLLTRLDFMLAEGTYYPGVPVGFAWRVWLPSSVHWRSADLEIVLVAGTDEEHLWNHVGIEWPPRRVSLEETDGIWPPIGWVVDTLMPLGGARTLLYSGLAPKTIRLKVTGHNSDGSVRVLTADDTLTVVLRPTALTGAFTSPRGASWGAAYSLSANIANSSLARLSVQATTIGDDHSSFPRATVQLNPGSEQTLTLAGPTTQNWPWNEHPTYHVREDQLSRRITYNTTLSLIEDEFGNPYPDVALAPWSVTVNVAGSKIDAAHEAEQDFWANAGLTGCNILSGILALIPILAPAAALVAGGCTGAMVLVSIDAGQWSQVADDPPTPDDDYWTVVSLPDPIALPEKDDLAPLNKMLALFCRISKLLLIASTTVGKILGASRAASDVAEAMQQQHFQQIVKEIQQALMQIPVLAGPAVEAVANHVEFESEKLKSLLGRWSSEGLSSEEVKLLTQALGPDAAGPLIKFLSEPKTAKEMRPMADIVAEMAPLVLRAAGSGVQELMDAMAISTKAKKADPLAGSIDLKPSGKQ